jgi:hypothetical protein
MSWRGSRNADVRHLLTKKRSGGRHLANYRCYLFDWSNKVQDVIDFGAASDAEACDEANKLHTGFSYSFLELWGSSGKIYSLVYQR